MRIGKQLTSGGVIDLAGLALIDEYNEDVPAGRYQPATLKQFAEELEGVEGRVEVSIQTVEHGSGESVKALVGRVEDTDIACFAAPLMPAEERNPEPKDDESEVA